MSNQENKNREERERRYENEDQNKKKKRGKWTRRAFIGTTGLLGTGLVVGLVGNWYVNKAIKKYSGKGMGEGSSLNAWIRISPDNMITLAIPRAEMGQGVVTAIPQLIAEELEVPMSRIKVIHPQPESPYANTYVITKTPPNHYKGYDIMEKVLAFLPMIGTGGSSTIGDAWMNMRYAGATAREMLKTVAAKRWNVAIDKVKAEEGFVINTANNEKLSYGELAADASKVELNGLPTLKEKKDFKLIGKDVPRLDAPEKVTGTAEFGIDVRLPGMLYAAIKHPTTIGGKIQSINNESEVMAMAGVKKIVITEFGPAAVVATNTWAAINAAKALDVEEDGANGDLSTASIKAQMDKLINEPPIKVRRDDGDVAKAFDSDGGKVIEARYDLPYLAHATMEPMNATCLVKDGKAEIWTGHQAASVAHNMAVEGTGIDKENITINITYLGGGFGRRGEPDYVRYAGAVAKEMPGVPIQTVFSREEDMQNDTYRPMAGSKFKAKLSEDGEIIAWDNMMILQSVENNAFKRIIPALAKAPEDDEDTAEGADDLPYAMQNQKVAFGNIELPIQIGFWRSVGYSQNSFFAESFMDECAHAAGQDPYQFRRNKLKEQPRHLAVLDKVAEMSNWNTPLPAGKSRGIALANSFNSIVAEVVELTQLGDKEFKIDKVYCAFDCGNVVNPYIIDAQAQGGIIFGLTAALFGEITWTDGAVDQLNFPQYEMVRMTHCPKIEVHIMDVDEYPGGVGEPGTPPAAPALANALFAATGKRVRTLPLNKLGYKFV